MGVSPVGALRHLRLETEPTHWWEVGALTNCTTGLLPIVHLLDKPTNAGQLYFSILIIKIEKYNCPAFVFCFSY